MCILSPAGGQGITLFIIIGAVFKPTFTTLSLPLPRKGSSEGV